MFKANVLFVVHQKLDVKIKKGQRNQLLSLATLIFVKHGLAE